MSWHQGSAALTARCAWRAPSPTRAVTGPCPVPSPRLRSSASPLAIVVTAPRMRLTASLPSGPDPVEGSSPRKSCAARANLGRSDLSSNGWPRSVRTTLAVLSISSLALPTASAGSSLIARPMRSNPSRMADGSASLAMDSIDSCGPICLIASFWTEEALMADEPDLLDGAGLALWRKLIEECEFDSHEEVIAVELCRTVTLCESLHRRLLDEGLVVEGQR